MAFVSQARLYETRLYNKSTLPFFRTGFRSKIQQLTLFLAKPCMIIAFINEDYKIFIESSLLGLRMSAKLKKKNASKYMGKPRCAVEVVNDVKGKRLRANLESAWAGDT